MTCKARAIYTFNPKTTSYYHPNGMTYRRENAATAIDLFDVEFMSTPLPHPLYPDDQDVEIFLKSGAHLHISMPREEARKFYEMWMAPVTDENGICLTRPTC